MSSTGDYVARCMAATLVFDVNETLLDLSSLRPGFVAIFGDAGLMGEWFARMLHGSLVANHTGNHRPFGTIGTEALLALATRRGRDLSPSVAAALVDSMRGLPAHPDVAPGLESLRQAGHRCVTLTNGAPDVARDQIHNAGLDQFFDGQFTVEATARFKPAPEPYLDTLDRLDVEPSDAMMVAAHDWDIAGAAAVGMQTAFVARPGAVWGIPGCAPTLSTPDLVALADALS